MPRFNLEDYVDVQTRINQFWADYPDGRIITRLLSDPNIFDRVVMQADVYKHRENLDPDASDIAAEEKGQGGMANATSWHENCSTSSVGRALATMGYAKTAAERNTREEMAKVVRGQAQARPPHADIVDNALDRIAPRPNPIEVLQQAIAEAPTAMAAPGQIAALTRMANDLEMVLDDRVIADFNVGSSSMLTFEQAGNLIVQLSKEREEHMSQDRHAKQRARHQELTQHLQTSG